MWGSTGWAERGADEYLPYQGHVRPNVLLLDNGSVLATGEMPGVPHELADEAERNTGIRTLNGLWKNIADDNVTICTALVRHQRVDDLPRAGYPNAFSAALDRAYRQRVLAGRLYQNSHFLSVIVSPRNPLGGTLGGAAFARLGSRTGKATSADDELIRQLDDIWQAIERTLDGYGLRRLALRPGAGGKFHFSEIAEGLRLILTGEYLPVPLISGPLGAAIYTDQAIFGRRAYEIRAPGASRFGAIFGFREYPATTWAGMFDGVLALPFPLVLAQSFGFLAKHSASSKLGLKKNQMTAAGDKAVTQIEELASAQDQLASGLLAMGEHHLSLAVYGDTLAELNGHAGVARTALADAGAVAVQESAGLEAAYFAQLPGNRKWRTRPGAITTKNFAALAGFESFPRGDKAGRWGQAMARFRTTAATYYDFIPHVGDVGMTGIFGKTGQGKTTFMLFLLALFPQYFHGRGAVVFFDKDRGGELLCRAMGGRYLEIRAGRDSGLAPLRGLDNTPESVAFLVSWLAALIGQDGHGPLPPDDDARLANGVQALLRMPPAMRSLSGLRQFLDWRNPAGAGARLERWCRGGSLGWAFDGDQDDVALDAMMVGFDLTALLENATVCAPAANYLLYRIRQALDGRRFVLSCDEFNFYLLNPLFAKIWSDFMLTVRKSNAVVLLATQEPAPVLASALGDSIIRQCQTLIFCPTPGADERVYRTALNLTAGEFRAIREDMLPGSRQYLIKRHDGSVIIDFDLSDLPEFVAVLSTRANTARFVERLRAECGDDPAAWLPQFMSRFHEAVD
ncbi:VirB4 family type IV secretion/conjugal transfer ATPase [Acidiphilium iwatense]|uniref:VirB4 family type IV secretion/conjugal transfer ATPase n=1 Tax=Acidiphilium iwatense TaxID=768198 RepID=A0ABS9DZU2_9PROT|nr:VirB4 family type IV secretion/conjugal transfer ATPase [Acidiphilium iwatense]MCF3948262.1 VirB4 family type IV secretion/conjugal transfer ATPase [Acidiphilium iwatense]